MTNTRERAREIVNRHLEYMDGLSRGQVMMKVSNAIAAVEEALATVSPLPVQSEVTEAMVQAAYRATGCPVSEHGPGPRNREFFAQIYTAMRSAAPQVED